MNTVLEVKNLNLSFKLEEETAQAIYDVSFSLEKGKTLGIVGESGSGKTVTAMSIMQLLAPNAVINSGEIIFDKDDLIKTDKKILQQIRGSKIALIPQDPLTSLNPLYTVGEQISETIRLHQKVSKKEAKEIAIKAMEDVNIPEANQRYYDYPHQFSGGMRQRAIIAMALSCKPEILIADEPTTALDVTIQAQIMNLINEIQEKIGTSLILITHDLGVVAETCDYVAVMYSGRIVEYADVKTIFRNPIHPYTMALIESLPASKEKKLKTIEGQPPSITDDIKGCPFHPRCKYKIDICPQKDPDFEELKQGHFTKCYVSKDFLE